MLNVQNGATTEDLRDQIATLRADLARLSSTASDKVQDGLDAAGRQAVETGREARRGVVDAVTANPLTAIGVAAGVGYLLGVLTRR